MAAMGEPPPLSRPDAIEARRGHRSTDVRWSSPRPGVGKVRAAVTATLLVERLGCRALVLSGVAGGLSEDAAHR